MSNMLAGVVRDGTGACAAIPGYTVAGKTGTSRKAVGGGYSHGTMASFIGFAPAQHPRLAAIVVLDEPTTQYGSTAAAPVFADVMQFALTRNDVASDDAGNAQYNAARAAAARTATNCDTPPVAALAATTPGSLGYDTSQSG
jgi:cell division protein FtsI (penicillin-binding protein 3)